ncbi:MAG: class I SAM-dependent methyltransferase [Chloroflexota bacterium]
MKSIIRSFWFVEKQSPPLRIHIWHIFYNLIAKYFPFDDVHFMNWGYVPLEGEPSLQVGKVDENNRPFAQMYAYTLGTVDVKNLDIAEIGSGRGGGAAWLAKTRHPRSVIGVEFAPEAVKLATRLHSDVPQLLFKQGDAHNIPLEDESVDVVVNVESCHHYASMEKFLSEVHRILIRPGGFLALADYRKMNKLSALQEALAASPLTLLETQNITRNVIAALDQGHDYKIGLLHERVPKPLHTIIWTFMDRPKIGKNRIKVLDYVGYHSSYEFTG